MKLDDLKQNFEQQIQSSSSEAKLTLQVDELKAKTKKYQRDIKVRDFMEISISLLLIPVWLYGLSISVNWMQSLGCVLATLTSLYIPYKLLKARRLTPTKNDSLRAYLHQEQQRLAQQKQLLETIVWWYIAPVFVSVMLITLGANMDDEGVIRLESHMQVYYLLVLLGMVGIYFWNKRAAEKRFGPLLARVEQQLNELNGE
ncbi:hypothetical protein C3B51_00390 [Pseudoalteromonas rubra]|uniref:Uncharacterized protein n=1 Tax=Pseudoalteromonas rubra TaxID=43658 RepID=A0A4Q7EMG3_9GAMM|nr:hypothetical protein [Pseudoalteromonas rubra]RZM85430.1 hypothetical protein C3B51_00390 [Pseudoalteromonas rubra]